MKRPWLLALLLAFSAFRLMAQDFVQGNLTASSASCATTTECVVLNLPRGSNSAIIQLSGTFVATAQFGLTVDGVIWDETILGDPSGGGASVSSATLTGRWLFNVAGFQRIRVRPSAYTSGTITVRLNASTAVSKRMSSISAGSLRAGGFISVGPALSSFNAFDQSTAAHSPSLIAGRNLPTDNWAPVTILQESNNTTPTWSIGLYSQSSSTNSTGTMSNVMGLFGEADSFATGTGTVANLAGVEGLTENHSGTTNLQVGVTSFLDLDAGATSTNMVDFYAQPAAIDGTVTNHYGLYIPNILSGATINQAIHTELGWVRFGDKVTVGSTALAPNNLLELKGSGTGIISLGQISDANTFGCITFVQSLCAIANYNIANNGTNLLLNAATGSEVRLSVNNVEKATVNSTGLRADTYQTETNCADGTATPADCGAAPAGHVIISASAGSVVVNTTAVTANSQIIIQEDRSIGARLSVTCNTSAGRSYIVVARTAGTSFTIAANTTPITDPACLGYFIVN